MSEIHVIKRNNRREKLDIQKIRQVIDYACYNLNVDKLELELDSQIYFVNNIKTVDIMKILINTAVSKISIDQPDWNYVAARLYLYNLYKEVSYNRHYKIKDKDTMHYKAYNMHNFIEFLKNNVGKIYDPLLIESYTDIELEHAYKFIKQERDLLFTYAGIKTLADRYLIKDGHKILELPQEMYLLISLVLAVNENKNKRLDYVKKFYDMLSTHKISLATPILLNARRKHRQLSSCFVLTVEDDLNDIFYNIHKSAMISKHAGGLGIYLGKLRSIGSPIQNYQNVGSGIVPVIKLINDTMVYVDQLGVRKGSASITIDIWHPDIFDFLELKTNSGDERKKAHDIHPAISIPDLFMKRLLNKEDWTLINPYYTKNIKDNKNLEDFYGKEFEELYIKLEKELPDYAKKKVNSFELWKKIITVIFETGEPYIFFRDTANKLNPNKHCGIIYSSNLCHEIVQNMSTYKNYKSYVKKEDNKIVYEYEIGDTVICNLGAINIGNLDYSNEQNLKQDLETRLNILVRMLDNTIDINILPDKSFNINNQKYRAIGIGVLNYHYALAKNQIRFESEEHLKFIDKLFEYIAFYTLKSSNNLAKERGKYPLFDNSDWNKSIYFGRHINNIIKETNNTDWLELDKNIQQYGLRNGYLLAIMPTGSTSIIIGATASIDPIFSLFFKEENVSGVIPQVVPEADKYRWYYKSAYNIDQQWIIKAASIRQKWIDQAQSLNLFIDPNNIDGPSLSNLYILAWQHGLKTVYYCRSKSITDINECDSCSV